MIIRNLIQTSAVALACWAGCHYTPHAAPAPAPCTFDGGGTIASRDAARTDTGTWVCTDGVLVHVTGYGNTPAAPVYPVLSDGVCNMQGVCQLYPYTRA